jgi:SHS family lactate transporter-like MFS transporter
VLPGFVYQLGNLIASVNATLQATIAEHNGHNYGLAMAIIAGTVALVIALLVFFGKDTRGKAITGEVKTAGVRASV